MYLGIRTDSPIAEIYLFKDVQKVASYSWQADRQLAKDLLAKIEVFLRDQQCSFDALTGLFVFQGPGSFTSLRIGMSVMNTIAYAQTVPIVGTQGDEWIAEGVKRLGDDENDQIVLPFYGAEARITKPRK